MANGSDSDLSDHLGDPAMVHPSFLYAYAIFSLVYSNYGAGYCLQPG